MLEATDEQLIERHGRWYLAHRDPVWWRRNALVVLGNIGDPTDPRVRRTVERYRGIPPYRETRDYVQRITGLYTKVTHPYLAEVTKPSAALARIRKLP